MLRHLLQCSLQFSIHRLFPAALSPPIFLASYFYLSYNSNSHLAHVLSCLFLSYPISSYLLPRKSWSASNQRCQCLISQNQALPQPPLRRHHHEMRRINKAHARIHSKCRHSSRSVRTNTTTQHIENRAINIVTFSVTYRTHHQSSAVS